MYTRYGNHFMQEIGQNTQDIQHSIIKYVLSKMLKNYKKNYTTSKLTSEVNQMSYVVADLLNKKTHKNQFMHEARVHKYL